MKKRSGLYIYILCALFAALTAVCSQIQIPLPFTPVPINLALLPVFICGAVLGPKYGAFSMIIYILLGVVGVPVFTGLSGGFGVIAGPTGGYIIGYVASAVVMGLLSQHAGSPYKKASSQDQTDHTGKPQRTLASVGLTILTGLPAIAACYAIGTVWFMTLTGTGFAASMLMCVIPFIPCDIIKIIFAAAVCEALRRPMRALNIGTLGGYRGYNEGLREVAHK